MNKPASFLLHGCPATLPDMGEPTEDAANQEGMGIPRGLPAEEIISMQPDASGNTSHPPAQVGLQKPPVALDVAAGFWVAFGSPHLDREDFAALVLSLAQGLQEQGYTEEAASLYMRLIDGPHPYGDPIILASMNSMALLLQSQGKFKQAEDLLQQALSRIDAYADPHNVYVLHAQNTLACLLQNQGKYTEARSLYVQTIAAQKRLLGPHHLDTITTLENLATLLYEQNELEGAECVLLEAVAQRRHVQGNDDVDTLRTCNNLALLLQKKGKISEAEALLRETLTHQQQVLGVEHPETLTTMSNLATLLEESELSPSSNEAETLHRQCLDIRRRALGETHPGTLISYNNLAAFLMDHKRFGEALPFLSDGLARAHVAFHASHYFIGNLQTRYGSCLSELKRYAEAETHLLEGYNNLKTALGQVHDRTQRACHALADLYEAWGKPGKAAPYRTPSSPER